VGVDLLLHAFVNIPDEQMHVGVFFFTLFNYKTIEIFVVKIKLEMDILFS
jgi:hypothetical protein